MTIPMRYRDALWHGVGKAMPVQWCAELGGWLHSHRSTLRRGGDDQGTYRFNYELLDVERSCELLAPFRKLLTTELENALAPCMVDPFELESIEMHATLYHHGSHFDWHTDADEIETRQLAFAYYMHSTPKRFKGGDLEFIDGTLVPPDNNLLVLFNPRQKHRVREVECWSSGVLDGRWALTGWLHKA